jgi:hypothetical protein
MDRYITLGAMKTAMKVKLAFSFCSVGLVVLVSLAYSNGLLPPRGEGIVLLILSIAIGTSGVLISKKLAKRTGVRPEPPGASVDDVTRKRRIRGIRAGKIAIIILLLLLIFGMRQDGPLYAKVVGAAVNLFIIAAIAQLIVRLQKSLH